MREWNDVGEAVATADFLISGKRQPVALVGFVVRYPDIPSFVCYRWKIGNEPLDAGPNHWPTVNKGLAAVYAKKDPKFTNVREPTGVFR